MFQSSILVLLTIVLTACNAAEDAAVHTAQSKSGSVSSKQMNELKPAEKSSLVDFIRNKLAGKNIAINKEDEIVAAVYASGHQVYGCGDDKKWKLIRPDAELRAIDFNLTEVLAKSGGISIETIVPDEAIGHHDAGPTWKFGENAYFLGNGKLKSEEAAVSMGGSSSDVAWLKIPSVPEKTSSEFDHVYRILTDGGKEPAGCSEKDAAKGATHESLRVPYRTVYIFTKSKNATQK